MMLNVGARMWDDGDRNHEDIELWGLDDDDHIYVQPNPNIRAR